MVLVGGDLKKSRWDSEGEVVLLSSDLHHRFFFFFFCSLSFSVKGPPCDMDNVSPSTQSSDSQQQVTPIACMTHLCLIWLNSGSYVWLGFPPPIPLFSRPSSLHSKSWRESWSFFWHLLSAGSWFLFLFLVLGSTRRRRSCGWILIVHGSWYLLMFFSCCKFFLISC